MPLNIINFNLPTQLGLPDIVMGEESESRNTSEAYRKRRKICFSHGRIIRKEKLGFWITASNARPRELIAQFDPTRDRL